MAKTSKKNGENSDHSRKRKGEKHEADSTKKKRQLVMQPKVMVEPIMSDASTLPYNLSGDVQDTDLDQSEMLTLGDFELGDLEEAGGVQSDASGDSLRGDEDEEDRFNQNAPLRQDMPVVRERWSKNEVPALLDAINLNRAALKFNFDGPGGGKDVKRQGWKDVAKYVNSTCNTHRTIKQCRDKTDDYTGRVKKKFNRLRYEVRQTGNGAIRDGLKISYTEAKALDYLREEAVRGIPGIEPMEIGGFNSRPSEANMALLWKVDREDKPDYTAIKMERVALPINYKDKNKRRVEREKKAKKKAVNEKKMKADRKSEKSEAKTARKMMKALIKERKREEKEMKEAISKNKMRRRREKEARRKDPKVKRKKSKRKHKESHVADHQTKKMKEERKAARKLRKIKKEKSREKRKGEGKKRIEEKNL